MRSVRYRTQSLRGGRSRTPPPAGSDVLAVSELVERIRATLEGELPAVRVSGEISNLATPASGHLYFHLKDERAALRCVLFRNVAVGLRFRPEDGLGVVARGRVSVYPARGDLQLIVEGLEPEGLGALAKAFEQLKARLAEEGLFDPVRKRSLPLLPRRVGVVTSPTGAVIRDIVQVARRRHPRVDLLVAPVRVQGAGAAEEIAAALRRLGESGWVDVVVAARGGGSLEDLWAFNEEVVARAIADCAVPVVSAVGHETDFTIADFVADLRAPTPSAAAELVVPDRGALAEAVARSRRDLERALEGRLRRAREELERLRPRPVQLRRALEDRRQLLDDRSLRSARALARRVASTRERIDGLERRLRASSPSARIAMRRERVGRDVDRLRALTRGRITALGGRAAALEARLAGLDPGAALARGYALVRPAGGGPLVRSPSEVEPGQELDVHLARGRIGVRVTDRSS